MRGGKTRYLRVFQMFHHEGLHCEGEGSREKKDLKTQKRKNDAESGNIFFFVKV
jgi:hypothetical protein